MIFMLSDREQSRRSKKFEDHGLAKLIGRKPNSTANNLAIDESTVSRRLGKLVTVRID